MSHKCECTCVFMCVSSVIDARSLDDCVCVCVCVYVCIHVHIHMYRLFGRVDV
jgi:hypothetical protein